MTTYTAHFTDGPVVGRSVQVDGVPPNDAPPARLQLAAMAPDEAGTVRVPMFDRVDMPYVLTSTDGTDAQYEHDA